MTISRFKKLDVDAVIFDLDGTILDSIGIYYQIIETVFQHLGMPMPSADKLREAAKTGDFEWDEVLPGKTRPEKDHLIKKAGVVSATIYPKMFEHKVQLIPQAKETLEHISQKGIKMGLVTSTPRQNLGVKQHALVNAGIEDLAASCEECARYCGSELCKACSNVPYKRDDTDSPLTVIFTESPQTCTARLYSGESESTFMIISAAPKGPKPV